jgi:hypothetical protein
MSPIPEDEDRPSSGARRSAMSPIPEGEEETIQLPLPRRSTEYGSGGGIVVQLPLPTPDLSPPPLTAPVQLVLPSLEPRGVALVQPSPDVDGPSPVTVVPPPDPYVQPTLPVLTPTPSWPVVPSPEVDDAVSAAEVSWSSTDAPPLDIDDHALFRRPAPGEPETQWDLTPISAGSPDEVVPVEQETTITAPTRRPGQGSRRGAKSVRARGSRRHLAWRDHKRLFTVLAIVAGLLLVVGGGGYLFSRFDSTLGGIAQGDLKLPLVAGDYRRDPTQGVSPSVHPASKISTVSATYTRGGVQQFVVIAYRPQTDPEAALQEIQARSVTRVSGGACGRTTDQNLACVVISGTTAVLAVTLVDQTTDDLIASAQSVAAGIGKD